VNNTTEATAAPARRRWPIALVFPGYLLLAFAAAWPLTADLGGLLPGDAGSDTGVYVWNLWMFRHQLVGHSTSPLWTDHILQPGPPVDLALHNYTIFQNVLALALIPRLGLVATFNVIWISMQALSAVGVFLLARRYSARDAIAFIAGALFAFSPTMIARSTAHQSLVAAAPLAFFLLFVLRAAERRSWSDAALAGAAAAWAGLCDAYYGVYCVLLFLGVLGARMIRFERMDRPRPHRVGMVLNALMVPPALAIAAILLTGGGRVDVLGLTIRAATLYTPVLVLTTLGLARLALAMRVRGRWRIDIAFDHDRRVQVVLGTMVCVVMLLPLLIAASHRIAGGGLQQAVFWRSSPPGVDLLWFLVPNPGHPLAPAALREFVTTRPDSYAENVASIPYVALVVMLLGVARARPPRTEVVLLALFGLLALGPFVTVAGFNSHVPGPWALLRYVPVIGAARTPTRFAIPMLLAIAVLFAWALNHVARRRASVGVVAALLALELLPVPRLTASARVPSVYSTIAADPDDVSVLEVPFGIWDGTSQAGFTNIATMYYQTRHEKRLVGGYLSRVPPDRVRRLLSFPTLGLLAELSAGRPAEAPLFEAARLDARSLVRDARVRYVVVDPSLASSQLRSAAIEIVGLRHVQTADGLELYRTKVQDEGSTRRFRTKVQDEGSGRRFNTKVQHAGSTRRFNTQVQHAGSTRRFNTKVQDFCANWVLRNRERPRCRSVCWAHLVREIWGGLASCEGGRPTWARSHRRADANRSPEGTIAIVNGDLHQ
jgi:hypothetical protein